MMTTIQKEKENNKKQARRDATKRGIRKRPLMNGKKRERERELYLSLRPGKEGARNVGGLFVFVSFEKKFGREGER